MTRLVSPDRIESLVGRVRHATSHYARAVPIDDVVYVLHSWACVDAHRTLGRDLTQCSFSRALDQGIDSAAWEGHELRPERVAIRRGRLVPVPDLDQPAELTLQQMAHEINTAGATNHRQWRMPARLAEPRPAARHGIPYGADPHGRCPACDRHIRPTGECGCSD